MDNKSTPVTFGKWNYKGYEELIEKKVRYKYYIRYILLYRYIIIIIIIIILYMLI